jgi:hypothetical protein
MLKIVVQILLLILLISCNKPEALDLVGDWNIKDIIYSAETSRLMTSPLGIYSDGSCYLPTNLQESRDHSDGIWKLTSENHKCYISFTTDNNFFNDKFLISYYEKNGLYRILILENDNKKILLKRFPPPVYKHPSPGRDWPQKYLDKEKQESKPQEI